MHKNLLNLMIKAQLKGHETLLPEVEKELHLENITDWRTKRGITDNEILAQCVLLFLAGYETTASTLTFFTYLMALNPEHQEKLHQEIEDVLGEVSILQLFRDFVANLIQDLRFLTKVIIKKV
ncbi:cytochrome P450 3A14 [Octopus bimaculoides]|nr:cytochrome P450 3A14 [Octopus bimaculoides]